MHACPDSLGGAMEVHLVPQIFGRGEVHCQNDSLCVTRLAICSQADLEKETAFAVAIQSDEEEWIE